ncbi:TonB-dependent receptor plug domain-containing protein [Desertivirga arenae]|uniref:TonB-dependent receptor plug domain-containing protein n=1 Tax=Desertivirga arenae TaxID=2810309 RepID=UPI001F613C6B|nr:TonB-dependent receptor plug domain-containing protein [Pedobacter sp. SYSU D00823]
MNLRNIMCLIGLLISTCFCFSFIHKEDDPLKNLLAKLSKYNAENVVEKVHLHTDRPYYAIGDTIWFKAYVVIGEKNQLSALSKFLYVDLINEKDSVKKSLRLLLNNGMSKGDIVLGDSLTEGNYRLRAYTTWMRNQGESFFFDKTFAVGNVLTNQIISTVNYSFSKVGVRENVVADLQYKDINGRPIANKEVTYSVQLDFRNIASGKGMTNAEGSLQIKFTNAQPFVLKAGRISTTVKLDTKTAVNKTFPVKSTSSESDVQFFPEGGTLVNGIRTRVGFKALGSDGLSREISGYISDNNNNRITDFKSEYAGMGSFLLLPIKGSSYKAFVKFADGSEKQVDLPKAGNEGYVLSVNNSNADNLFVKVTASENLLNKGDLTLIATNNGVVQYVSKNRVENSVFSGTIPKNRFQRGILQLTLFSSDYQPVAERLVFINKNDLALSIKTDKASYGKRQKVTVDLATLDSGKAARAALSIAVINESTVPFDDINETSILSNLLLTSDLKGYIEKPNYYFTEPLSSQKVGHLDNLMLTQGWRRYSWKSIVNNSYPNLTYSPERNITLSGRVVNANGSPVIGGNVILLPAKGKVAITDTITDKEGRFTFPGLSFNDSTTFVLQARNTKGKKNVYIEIDALPGELVSKNRNAASLEVNVNQSLIGYLKKRSDDFEEMRKNGLLRKSIMLAEVKVAEKKPVLTNSSNLNGAGNADAIIKADKLINCLNLAQCLQGMVAGIIVQNGIAYSTRSMYSSFSGLVPMQLIIDGMYVDPTYLSIIAPQDVESIEVLKSAGNVAIYGIRGGGGVLIINTKRGERNLSYRRLSPGIASFKPQGIFSSREFYSPMYATPTAEQLIDRRNTIYWNPDVITNEDGKTSLSFYTADEPGTYKVVVEGLDAKGSLVRKIVRFIVL